MHVKNVFIVIARACLAYLSRSTHSVTRSVKNKVTSQIKFGSLSSAGKATVICLW